MHFFFIVFLFFTSVLSSVKAEDLFCHNFLIDHKQTGDVHLLDKDYDYFVLLQKLNSFKNSEEFLHSLNPETLQSGVRIHTSRSIHRAYLDFPRTIYTDTTHPQQTLIYAFSTKQDANPVVEMQVFNHVTKESSFFEVDWDAMGRLHLMKNPRMCFNCHSGARPLFSGMPSHNTWPFSFKEDIEASKKLEKILSNINNQIQLKTLNKAKLSEPWFDLLRSAIYGDNETFNKKLSKFKMNHSSSEIEEYFFYQRNIFFKTLGTDFNKSRIEDLNLDEERTLRIFKAFYVANLLDFMDLLSLNIRPNNFELSSETIDVLQAWLKHIPKTSPVKKRWIFFNPFQWKE